jgi:hypothetical protein
MPASFVQAFENAGFDQNFDSHGEPHPWLMVPLGGFNHAVLQWSSGLSLRLRDTQIVTMETFPTPIPQMTRVRLRGLQAGETVLEVMEPGRNAAVARLDLSVLPKKTVQASFHFLTDAEGHISSRMGEAEQVWFTPMRGPMTMRTRPRSAQSMLQCVQQCLKELNDIFPPQTNISFVLRNLGQAHVNRDLHDHVQASSLDLMRRVRMLKDPSARVNVFFIWDLVVPRLRMVGYAPRGDNICLVDDQTLYVGHDVTHEVGHILLRPLRFHHFTGPAFNHMLMSRWSDPAARFIPKRQAIHMNRRA